MLGVCRLHGRSALPTLSVVVVLLSVCFSPAASASPLSEGQLLAIVGDAVEADSLQPLRDIEQYSIPSSRGRAVRDDDSLVVTLNSGAKRIYQDRPECRSYVDEARCELYLLVAYLDRNNSILIAHMFWEDLRFILLDRDSGLEAEVSSFPVFSPSGKYILVLENSAMSGSQIQIWRHQDNAFSLEAKRSPNAGVLTTYSLQQWSEDGFISIRSKTWDGSEKPEVYEKIALRLVNNRWQRTE